MITGGGGGPSYPAESAEQKRIEGIQGEMLDYSLGKARAIETPYLTGIGKRKEEIAAGTEEVKEANPEWTRLQSQIATKEEQMSREGSSFSRSQMAQQISDLKAKLKNTPQTIVSIEATKPKFNIVDIPEADRINPQSQYYDPVYKKRVEAQNQYNTAISEMSRVSNLEEGKISELITKYNDYDTQTQDSILKLTGITAEQATLLSSQANILKGAQTDSETTRGLAENTIQGALAGKLPSWLQLQINEAINTEKERLSRFGATSGRIPEMESRIKLQAIPQLLSVYEPISTKRYDITAGLSKDITGIGQTKLTNQYNLENARDLFAKTGIANREKLPVFYSNLAQQQKQIADAKLTEANAYNILAQQQLQNLERYANIGR